MLHCDLRVRWKVASDLRFRAAISEPKTPSFCGIFGDLAQSTRKSLAIAIVRFWCAKIIAFRVFPLFLPSAITAFSGPESRFNLAIVACKAFEPIFPRYHHRLGKMDKKSLDSLIPVRKTNKHKHSWRDGVRNKEEPSLRKNGTRPWGKPGPVPGTSRPFSVEFHSEIAILSLGRVGVRPWGTKFIADSDFKFFQQATSAKLLIYCGMVPVWN